MIKEWNSTNEEDLRKLVNTAQRHAAMVMHDVEYQNKKIHEIINQYKIKKTTRVGENIIVHLNEVEHGGQKLTFFRYFEHIGKTEDEKNIFNIIKASLAGEKFDFLEIATHINTADLESIFTAEKGIVNLRISPFGGPSGVYLYRTSEPAIDGYRFEYARTGDGCQLAGGKIIDNQNYALSYSNRITKQVVDKNESKYEFSVVGSIHCSKGEVKAYLNAEDDFKVICNMYETRNILKIPDKCMSHYEIGRQLI